MHVLVVATGLFWPLEDATPRFGSTLGISNEMTGATARVSADEGILLVVHTRPARRVTADGSTDLITGDRRPTRPDERR